MSFRFQQPSNEADFELYCLRLLREVWRCSTLQRYGKRGERQDGIDLIDEGGTKPLRAVQCKHHEPDKTLPPAELKAEIAKALASSLPIDEYYVLTSARKTTQTQNAIIEINRDHVGNGKFKVFLWTWPEIEDELSQLDDGAQERVTRGDTGRSAPAICNLLSGVMAEHFDRPLYSSATALDAELDGIKATLDRHELEVAEAKLAELETRAADKLQPPQWYQLKVLKQRVFCSRWQWENAGRELIDAKRFMPTTERARINEALGLELVGEREKAHALATELRKDYAHTVRLLAIWLRTAPQTATFDSLVVEVQPLAKDDEELNLALAQRAIVANRLTEAVIYATRATELDSDSPQAWFILGQAKHTAGVNSASVVQMALIREADGYYDRASALARTQRFPGLEAAIRFNRGKVRYLLGDARADADYAAAVELAPDNWELRHELPKGVGESTNIQKELRVVQALPGEPKGDRLFYEAVARYERNLEEDRQVAQTLLKKWSKRSPAVVGPMPMPCLSSGL